MILRLHYDYNIKGSTALFQYCSRFLSKIEYWEEDPQVRSNQIRTVITQYGKAKLVIRNTKKLLLN